MTKRTKDISESDGEYTIEYSDQVKRQMAQDPKLAAYVREFAANIRQATKAVKDGQYKTMEDAMEAITGSRPQEIDPDE